MSQPIQTMQADVVVAGAGLGGATVARELSKKGKKVILCEAGKYHQRLGKSTVFLLGMMGRKGLTFSKEGTFVLRPKTAGGATVLFLGAAFRPPPWLQEKYGIDLTDEVDELYKEIPIQKLTDPLVGPAARKTMSIMIKVRDGLDGRINLDESFSKPLDYDTWWKLKKGAVLAEEILMKAGVKRDDLVKTAISATHPGGTVRLGELLTRTAKRRFRTSTVWAPRSCRSRGAYRPPSRWSPWPNGLPST